MVVKNVLAELRHIPHSLAQLRLTYTPVNFALYEYVTDYLLVDAGIVIQLDNACVERFLTQEASEKGLFASLLLSQKLIPKACIKVKDIRLAARFR